MSDHYAIELTLMLYHEGYWIRSFTYYNHGECPPFGGVRSDATVDPVVLDMQDFENNVNAIESWKRHVISVVKTIKPVPKEGRPELPLEYNVESVDDTIVYRFSMESMEMTVTYDKSAKTITFAPRDAFDVSWEGFLFHQETMLHFLAEIKGQA